MNQELAEHFAQEWVSAWNSHDLDGIMSHYDENIRFYSPVIQLMKVNDEGLLTDKTELRNYFDKALQRFPDLHFELYKVLTGINSVILYYKSINNRYAAEYMELNANGKVIQVKAHYTEG